jgi:hypothetical protein
MVYAGNFNTNSQSGQIEAFKLTGLQNGKTLIDAALTEPVKISTKKTNPEIGKSSFYLKVNDLDLADWQAVLGRIAPAGKINVNLNAAAENGGTQITGDLTTTIAGLKVISGTNTFENLGGTAKAQLTVQGMTNLNVSSYDVLLTSVKDELLRAHGKATVNLASGAMQTITTAEAHLVPAIALLRTPDMKLQSGSVKLALTVDQATTKTSTNMTVKGSVTLTDLTGKLAGTQLNKLQSTTELNLEIGNAQDLNISKLTAALQHAGKPAGTFDLSGTYSMAKASGKIEYNLSELNENLLSVVVAPALTNATLTSISINSKGSAVLDPKAETAIKADLQVSRLVVTDKAGKLPKDPLTISAKLDASKAKDVLNLKNVQLVLTPTDRAKNEVALTGKVDSSKTNAITGNIKLSSEGLDLTRYYNLFAGNTVPEETPAPAPVTSTNSNQEPEAIVFPCKNLQVDIDVKKLYLREIAAENWLTTVVVDGGRVKMDPAQMTLNGAPLMARADLDLSVPGFRYDLVAKATKIPLAPIANSFAPEYKERAAGDLFADINIKGAGTTGKNLQQNLAGTLSLNFTNANIQIVEKGKFYPVISAVALILRVPELLKSPLNAVAADVTMGKGIIDMQRAGVHSPAFIASTAGKIPIADVLTNSPLNQPVDFYLAAGLAKHFAIANTNTNNTYVQMPGFLTLKGTLGAPKPDIKELVIIGLLTKSVTTLPVDLGDKGNKILKGVGNILTGQPMTTNAPPQSTTNAPSQTTTNKPSVLDALDFFKKKK